MEEDVRALKEWFRAVRLMVLNPAHSFDASDLRAIHMVAQRGLETAGNVEEQ